jgi:hypothetical protein
MTCMDTETQAQIVGDVSLLTKSMILIQAEKMGEAPQQLGSFVKQMGSLPENCLLHR